MGQIYRAHGRGRVYDAPSRGQIYRAHHSMTRWWGRRIGRNLVISKITLTKLADSLQNINERLPLLRKMILHTRRNLRKSMPLYKTYLLKHFEALRNRLGADITHCQQL